MQKPSNQQGKTPQPQADQQGSDKLLPQQDRENNPTATKGNREEQRNQKQDQSQQSAADRGAPDAQYGTESGKSGRTSEQAKPQSASNPGSSEKSTGAKRDTLSGSRDGERS